MFPVNDSFQMNPERKSWTKGFSTGEIKYVNSFQIKNFQFNAATQSKEIIIKIYFNNIAIIRINLNIVSLKGSISFGKKLLRF